MKKARVNRHFTRSSSSAIELSAPVRPAITLSAADREYLIAKLAEILVLDYQQSQGVSGPSVEKGGLLNRRQEAEASEAPSAIKAG